MAKYLDLTGLTKFKGLTDSHYAASLAIDGTTLSIKSASGAVLNSITVPQKTYGKASGSADGLMSKEDFTKLAGISAGANKTEASGTNGNVVVDGSEVTVYTHPSATAYESGFYKVTVNSLGHVTAATAVAKSDITALGIPAQDTTYGLATTTADGLLSKEDFAKLEGVSAGANKTEVSGTNGNIKIDGTETTVYTHPSFTAKTAGLYKVTVDANGHVTAATAVVKADITDLGIPAQDTTYSLATAAANGLMSKEHFSKVEGIAAGAQVNVLEGVQVNGSDLPITSKKVNIDLTPYALKTDITSVYKYKGSVESYSDLPASGQTVGDVYDIQTADATHGILAGDNVAWNGTTWDRLGGTFVIASISNDEIDALFA